MNLKGLVSWGRRGFLGLLLCGCATPYRPMQNGTGFAEAQIAPDRFVVTFQGNSQTKSSQASDFALLRAAQLTLEHGFSCFAVTDVTNTSSVRTYVARQRIYTDYPPNMGLGPPTPFGYDPYRFGYIVEYQQPMVDFRPGERLWIHCFRTKPEKPFTYDATALEQSLRQKYKLNGGAQNGR